MTDPLLTSQQVVALTHEVDDVAALLRRGLELLRTADWVVHDAAPTLACLATGSEKLPKLTVGLVALEEQGLWPDQATMRDKYRHRILLLDADARAAVGCRLDTSTAPGEVRRLFDAVAADPVLDGALAALDSYGRTGRFHSLDVLSAATVLQPSPAELWDGVAGRGLSADPALLLALSEPDRDREARARVNGLIADSVDGWWELYWRAWVTGTLGSRASAWAATLR